MSVRGIIIVLIIILITSGISAVWDIVKPVMLGCFEFIKFLGSLIIQFPSELGVYDAINTRVMFLIIVFVASGIGIGLSAKTKKKVFAICGAIISFISLLMTFASA